MTRTELEHVIRLHSMAQGLADRPVVEPGRIAGL